MDFSFTRGQECDPEDAEPGWPLRPPDREEELQRRTQATGTQRECGPELGQARVTKREQRWAEGEQRPSCRDLRREAHREGAVGSNKIQHPSGAGDTILKLQSRVGRRDHRSSGRAAEMNPGDRDPARMWTRTRTVQSYEVRAALGSGEESQASVSDSGDDPAAETGGGKPARKAPTGPDQCYEARAALGKGGDDPAAETGRGKLTGKATAGPDQSYEARAALGRGEESRAPLPSPVEGSLPGRPRQGPIRVPQGEEAPRMSTEAEPPLEGPAGLGREDPPLRVRDNLIGTRLAHSGNRSLGPQIR
ncbi:hypothetical protein NDU88_006236 [Pleurodeles waltl]|uniref:Uncharacterized protein n=1 Tax=Pleurodeles waltl TaxID=8319 RepID=A0AAV7UM74_PLEWA|nr:hypothetical protein NDU88_006236 [Pleurodeles waltl]